MWRRRPSGASIYVDYAHKPAGLEAVLTTLRPHADGRLFVLFGCGGDRDRGKRPQMGEIAAMLADRVIITDDNPRSEDPATIRAAILAAAPVAPWRSATAPRRSRSAIGELKQGDLLVIAGKGHETYQIIGKTKHPFDDSAVARAVVRELSARCAVSETRAPLDLGRDCRRHQWPRRASGSTADGVSIDSRKIAAGRPLRRACTDRISTATISSRVR